MTLDTPTKKYWNQCQYEIKNIDKYIQLTETVQSIADRILIGNEDPKEITLANGESVDDLVNSMGAFMNQTNGSKTVAKRCLNATYYDSALTEEEIKTMYDEFYCRVEGISIEPSSPLQEEGQKQDDKEFSEPEVHTSWSDLGAMVGTQLVYLVDQTDGVHEHDYRREQTDEEEPIDETSHTTELTPEQIDSTYIVSFMTDLIHRLEREKNKIKNRRFGRVLEHVDANL